MSVIPYLSHGIGVPIDPLTGLPRKKKQPAFTAGQVNASLAANPLGTFGPSSGVSYPTGGAVAARPAGQPDYKALIEQALSPLKAQLGAEGIADLSGRDNQIIRTLGQFGEEFDLGGAEQAFGAPFVAEAGLGNLLPQANKLAAETTGAGVSYKARASQAHKKAVQQIRDSLAQRGLLRSGATGVALQEQQQAFDTSQYDARTQVQDFLGAVHQGYLQAQRQRQAQLDAATREEAGRQAELNPWTGSPAAAAPAPVAPPPPANYNLPAAGVDPTMSPRSATNPHGYTTTRLKFDANGNPIFGR